MWVIEFPIDHFESFSKEGKELIDKFDYLCHLLNAGELTNIVLPKDWKLVWKEDED